MMSGFWEGANPIPQSSLYRRDWTPTSAAMAYRKLIFDKCRTRWQGKADANGLCRIPVFFRRHRVTIDGVEREVYLKKLRGKETISFK